MERIDLAIHPHGNEALVLHDGVPKTSRFLRWSLHTEAHQPLQHDESTPRHGNLVITPDGEWFFALSAHGPVRYRWRDLMPDSAIHVHSNRDFAGSFSGNPANHWLAVVDPTINYPDDGVHLIDWDSGRTLGWYQGVNFGHSSGCALDPTGSWLAFGYASDSGGCVSVLRCGDGRLVLHHDDLLTFEDHDEGAFVDAIFEATFSPDGRRLAIFSTSWRADRMYADRLGWYGQCFCYEVATGRLRWRQHLDAAVTGKDHPERPREIARLRGELAPHTQPVFSADGQVVLYGAPHGRVVVFAAEDGTWLRTIQLPTTNTIECLARCPATGAMWALTNLNGPPQRVPLAL